MEAGWTVEVCHDGSSAFAAAADPGSMLDVILLDWMLPGMDGPTVCRRLRNLGCHTPVLMLTARVVVRDRVAGLMSGADDFSSNRSISTSSSPACMPCIVAGPVGTTNVPFGRETSPSIRRPTGSRATVRRSSCRRVSSTSFACFFRCPGRVVSRFRILDEVWEGESDIRSNVIDVHVASLRSKIDRPFGTQTITTVRNVGYRVDADTTP